MLFVCWQFDSVLIIFIDYLPGLDTT